MMEKHEGLAYEVYGTKKPTISILNVKKGKVVISTPVDAKQVKLVNIGSSLIIQPIY